MNAKKSRVLIITAVVLLSLAAAAGIFLLLDRLGTFSKAPDKTKEPSETHEPVVYKYDDSGKLYSKVFYEPDGTLTGSEDYVTSGEFRYIIHFDSENRQIGFERSKYDNSGNVIKYDVSIGEGENITVSIEYSYDEKTSGLSMSVSRKFNEDGEETDAVKCFYNQDGSVTEFYIYENGQNEVMHGDSSQTDSIPQWALENLIDFPDDGSKESSDE